MLNTDLIKRHTQFHCFFGSYKNKEKDFYKQLELPTVIDNDLLQIDSIYSQHCMDMYSLFNKVLRNEQ